MAKTGGTQNVPSELLDLYRGTLGEQDPKKNIGKRFPYRLPHMQTVGGHPSKAQAKQRARFNESRVSFADVSPEQRTRWYANEPEYGSYLWYYNYFIMSSLLGNANINQGGSGVIKSIQHVLITIPAGTGEGSVALDAIDITKAVVMLNGGSLAIDDESGVFWASQVFPYVSSLASELLKCKWSIPVPYVTNTKSAVISATVIEYI